MQSEVEKIITGLYRNGVQDLILCPGSRNAPLLIGVAASGWFNLHQVPDERTAGFTAMGMARTLRQPVGVICTSGSALVNLYPAVVEAYYQQVPLLVIAADRPREWIDQMDGQTIRQPGLMEQHLRSWLYLDTPPYPTDLDAQLDRLFQTAVTGPMHLNLPFREPFYPEARYRFSSPQPEPLLLHSPATQETLPDAFIQTYTQAERVVLLAGSADVTEATLKAFRKLSARKDWLVLAETDSALAPLSNLLFWEQSLPSTPPDLLITLGYSFLSKTLKQWLREAPDLQHWFITPNGIVADTFRHFSGSIVMDPTLALYRLEDLPAKPVQWAGSAIQKAESLQPAVDKWLQQAGFSEPFVVGQFLKQLEPFAHLEVANSMPVRWVQALQPLLPYGVTVKANRGTSGIDGCVSTAVGVQKALEQEVYLLCGDLAFFYDSNAFWQQPAVGALKVLVLNNRGGRIFELIKGPGAHPQYMDYFTTPHQRSPEWICKDHGIPFTRAVDAHGLQSSLNWLKEQPGMAVVEVVCDPAKTAAVWADFKAIFS